MEEGSREESKEGMPRIERSHSFLGDDDDLDQQTQASTQNQRENGGGIDQSLTVS